MTGPIKPRLAVVLDHDTFRDSFRHFLDASRRLTNAYGMVKEIRPPLPSNFVAELDAAITDLMLARDAMKEAELGQIVLAPRNNNEQR